MNSSESVVIDMPQSGGGLEDIDSDAAKIQRFMLWMEENGATFPSVKIESGRGGRETYAGTPLPPGGLVMHIPRSLMITTEVAKASRMGQLIASNNLNFSDYGYITAHLLELKHEGGFWKPYMDVLPQDLSEVPALFSDSELAYLKGSYVLPDIMNQKEWIDYEYGQLVRILPGDWQLTREEYAWAKVIVTTRVHAVTLSSATSVAMVPLADMLNHSGTNENVLWGRESTLGFLYAAYSNIETGTPLTITYGRKCNGKLFWVYGFCLEDNPKNAAEIRLPALPSDHPYSEYSKKLGKERDGFRVFAITADNDHPETHSLFSYLRVSLLDTSSDALKQTPYGAATPRTHPISAANEAAVLTTLAEACQRRLQDFDTSIEEDEALLRDDALPPKLKNAVRVRLSEKSVLKYYIDLAEAAIPVLQWETRGNQFADYFANLRKSLWAVQN